MLITEVASLVKCLSVWTSAVTDTNEQQEIKVIRFSLLLNRG